jgi:hypothetical protein
MQKKLIAFDGSLFQVLDLPSKPIESKAPKEDPAAIAQLIRQSIKEVDHD